MRNILIYNPKPGPRSEYVFSFIFDSVLEWPWRETDNFKEFFDSRDICINYSHNRIDHVFSVYNHDFLNEKSLHSFEPEAGVWNGIPVIFPSDGKFTIPFDLFSAVFFLISRYEEYMAVSTDIHGRFPAVQSIAYRHKFLDRPVVDEWIYALAAELRKVNNDIEPPARTFMFQPTIDIDNAFAFKHKGFLRSAGGYFRSLFTLKFGEIGLRTLVLIGTKRDPYDTYAFIKTIHRQLSLSPVIFILGGHYGKYDKNISHHNRHFRKLVIEACAIGDVGLHPSYNSSLTSDIGSEKKVLEKISGNSIKYSRQHFLMLKFPDTYRMLMKAGIENDYSMGYSNFNGFRAGTCTPFYFYDLVDECRKDLLIHPFNVIDVAFQHQEMSPADATKQIEQIIERVKSVNGTFVSVWHNESMGNYKKWTGWKEVYKRLIKLAVQKTNPYE